MNYILRHILLVVASTLIFISVGCGRQEKVNITQQEKSGKDCALTDKPLADYQNQLLDISAEISTSIPIKPHIKSRSRVQERVVTASLELDQPLRALMFIEKIDNWRRGSAYGDLAFYCARQDYCFEEVQRYLDLASEIADTAEGGWRRDTIRVKIAKTNILLGELEIADKYKTDLVDSESGKVVEVKAMIAGEDLFDEQMNELNSLTATASDNYDILQNALNSYTKVFTRNYNNVERRATVEAKIKTLLIKVPIFKRVELLMNMARFALDNTDQAKALELVNEAQTYMDGADWSPRYYIQFMAKLIELYFQAGNEQKARTDLDSLFDFYNSQESKIVNIYRAGTLRPIAEVYQSMDNTAAALDIYKQAVEAGLVNQNSRPRAEDLSDTCLSMALNRVEPDAELLSRIYQINEGLGDPW